MGSRTERTNGIVIDEPPPGRHGFARDLGRLLCSLEKEIVPVGDGITECNLHNHSPGVSKNDQLVHARETKGRPNET